MIERLVQVRKKDAAFFYAVMESLEGLVAYSTVDYVKGGGPDSLCVIALLSDEGLQDDVEDFLNYISNEIPITRAPLAQELPSSAPYGKDILPF